MPESGLPVSGVVEAHPSPARPLTVPDGVAPAFAPGEEAVVTCVSESLGPIAGAVPTRRAGRGRPGGAARLDCPSRTFPDA